MTAPEGTETTPNGDEFPPHEMFVVVTYVCIGSRYRVRCQCHIQYILRRSHAYVCIYIRGEITDVSFPCLVRVAGGKEEAGPRVLTSSY